MRFMLVWPPAFFFLFFPFLFLQSNPIQSNPPPFLFLVDFLNSMDAWISPALPTSLWWWREVGQIQARSRSMAEVSGDLSNQLGTLDEKEFRLVAGARRIRTRNRQIRPASQTSQPRLGVP